MDINRQIQRIAHPRRTIKNFKLQQHDKRLYGGLRTDILWNDSLTPPPLPQPQSKQPQIVVSLTSYGPRLSTVHIAIKSMMLQTVKPNKIVLYLGTDTNDIELPENLTRLQSCGLEIKRGYPDYKSHKKYYFAMQEFTDSLIVLIDDDLVYEEDVIETLMAAHAHSPQCIVGRRAHRIRLDESGQIATYGDWDIEWQEDESIPRKSLLITTGAGSLYPPYTFEHLLCDPEVFLQNALSCDDIYLKVLETRAGILTAYAPNSKTMPDAIEGTQQDALWHQNWDGGQNDRSLKALMERFDLNVNDFVD